MEFILDRLLLPTLFGAVGWFATHFVVKPILAFHELRQRVHEAVFFTANVTDDPVLVSGGPERFGQAVAELRRLAAKLTALDVAANWMAHAYFRLQGYDVRGAAVALTNLSNVLGSTDGSALPARQRKALRLASHGLYQ